MQNDRLGQLLAEVRKLEEQIVEELHTKEKEYGYKIHETGVRFADEIRRQHRKLRKALHRYLLGSRFLVLLTTPVIYACFLPIVLLDLICSLYQWICFPIYGIPYVRRREYVSFDRHHLQYLNLIEKINCEYCAYANGVLNYVVEIAARTEQYWCPIKHYRCVKCTHKRYRHFLDFGDAEGYSRRLAAIRSEFRDI